MQCFCLCTVKTRSSETSRSTQTITSYQRMTQKQQSFSTEAVPTSSRWEFLCAVKDSEVRFFFTKQIPFAVASSTGSNLASPTVYVRAVATALWSHVRVVIVMEEHPPPHHPRHNCRRGRPTGPPGSGFEPTMGWGLVHGCHLSKCDRAAFTLNERILVGLLTPGSSTFRSIWWALVSCTRSELDMMIWTGAVDGTLKR